MARNKQQLINYHTGSATAMPLTTDVQFGEIVVRHNSGVPQLMIKVNDNGTEKFVPFIASGAVSTAISAAITDAEGTINSDISSLSGSIKTLSGSVVNNYYTSAETNTKIGDAKTELIGVNTDDTTADTIWAAKKYADAQDDALSGRINTYISETIENNLTSLDERLDTATADITALKTFSGKVETDYATKTEVQTAKDAAVTSAYTNAKADVIGTSADNAEADTVYGAKAYASSLTHTLSGNVVAAIEGATSDVSDLSGSVVELSGSVISMSADVKTYIDNELSTVYTYKGSVANVDALDEIENPEVGDVYNVLAAQGTPGTADFIPAGTNYAWVSGSPEGHWDALGGTVDLSAYATNDALNYVSGQVGTLQSADAAVKASLSAVSSTLFTVSASVVNDYATKTFAETAADNSAQSALTRANAYTDTQVKDLSGNVVTYVDGKVTTINQEISSIKGTYAVSSITHTEIETAKSTVIGVDGDAKTADTIHGAKAYADDAVNTAVAALKGNASASGDTLEELEAAINALAESSTGDVEALEQRVATLETFKTQKEGLIDSAIQGGKLGTVSETTAGNGVTIQHGAKMKEVAGGDITLDLSELIIDCGEF